jgi:predicted transcriptional regulator
MAVKDNVTIRTSPETKQKANRIARYRASAAMWTLEVAIFLYSILTLIIILATYTKVRLEIVAAVAIVGLAIVWMAGWRRERALYQLYYDEEVSRLEEESKKTLIEEEVEKALRRRRR